MMMRIQWSLRPVSGALLAGALLALPQQAAAQGWMWGGGSAYGGSGREVVGFSPQYKPGQIIVSFGDRRLYHIVRTGEAVSYPIAIPRDQSRWQGVMSVTMKRENPSWTPTPAMRRENPRLPSWVPGGHPLNPMGVRALYLGSSAYRIHGTDAPWTIGAAVSKGCIRMYNQDVLDLYPRVPVGTRVTVTWQTFRGGSAVASSSGYGSQSRQRVASAEPASYGYSSGPSLFSFFDDPPPQQPERRVYSNARKPVTKRTAGSRSTVSQQQRKAPAPKPARSAAATE
jgi:hypothetical protein